MKYHPVTEFFCGCDHNFFLQRQNDADGGEGGNGRYVLGRVQEADETPSWKAIQPPRPLYHSLRYLFVFRLRR